MRIPLTLVALLPLAAQAADEPVAASGEMEESYAEDIVVTATRDRRVAADTPASISRIDYETIAAIGSKHQADVLNRNAGVYIQRGSGAESLAAIRSPVLAGAGACGAFLVAEDSLPIRPTGFCNNNEMFEVNYEQARQIEVLRGPGSSMFGASAVHGVINTITPAVRQLPEFEMGLEGGSDSFKRVTAAGSWYPSPDGPSFGAYGVATRAPGWRDESGVDEAKLNLLGDIWTGGGQLRLRASGTVLNQETAGFIQGYNSYKDEDIARSNPNPEAFRDASSARVSAQYENDDAFGEGNPLQVAAIYRRSRMDFLQHFLIGKPLEHNAQTSYMLSGTAAFSSADFMTTRVTVDAELAGSELTEYQPGPATDGAPPANAIRPAGYHYDYTVDSSTVGATLAFDFRIGPDFTVTAAVRADQTNYDYDNHMIDGNTRDNGTSCAAAGCLYSRPADRTDRFENFSPALAVAWRPGSTLLYANLSTGFRPPETTELYRLQRQQSEADLDSENLDSVEVGWKFRGDFLSLDGAFFEMKKDDVILRETNGFNVGNGATHHRGFEYEARLDRERWSLSLNGTFARHEYAFSRAVEGGETIVDGNDVDTAPRSLHALAVDARLGESDEWQLGLDVNYVGKYFLDAANTATYPGHTVANARIAWSPAKTWRAALRVDNLFDTRYADRADFAFGNYRYFPARGRAVFLSVDYARN
ncbi:MAG TPA: TonB-dependent receptor [Steroidobacteraceae bacterium]|nr:TonB-dependent receptor [Steroidobacteraceae bacterium]